MHAALTRASMLAAAVALPMLAHAAPPRFGMEVVDGGWSIDSNLLGVSNDGRLIGWTTNHLGTHTLWTRSPEGVTTPLIADGTNFAARLVNGAALVSHEDTNLIPRLTRFSFPLNQRVDLTPPPAAGVPTSGIAIAEQGRISYTSSPNTISGSIEFKGFTGTIGAMVGLDRPPMPSGAWTIVSADVKDMNDAGSTVGTAMYRMADGRTSAQAAIWDAGGRIRVLPAPASSNPAFMVTTGGAINSGGTVAGTTSLLNPAGYDGLEHRLTIWPASGSPVMIDGITWPFPTQYAAVASPMPNDINAQGLVVGTTSCLDRQSGVEGDSRAFLVEGGRMYDLNTLLQGTDGTWIITQANAINDAGVIAATGRRMGHEAEFAIRLFPQTTPPPPPPAAPTPALLPESDTGRSSTDGLTSARDLRFRVTTIAGARVRLHIDGAPQSSTSVAGSDGSVVVTVTNAPAGRHEYAVSVARPSGPEGSRGSATVVVKEVTPPPRPSKPEVLARDRVSVDRSGNVTTRNTKPRIEGTVQPGRTVNVYRNNTLVATLRPNSRGDWRYTPAQPLALRAHDFVVKQVSASGLESAGSTRLRVTVVR